MTAPRQAAEMAGRVVVERAFAGTGSGLTDGDALLCWAGAGKDGVVGAADVQAEARVARASAATTVR
jgi:hypothetical protein